MNIGFIGLGIMGLPMAEHLVQKSGCPVVGFDVAAGQREKFSAAGGQAAERPEEVFPRCQMVFLSLPNNDLVDANLGAAVTQCPQGAVVVDLSSAYPAVIQAHQQAAEAAGIGLVDCPVSGGEAGAVEGTLAAMCGGREADVARAMPYLKLFSASVIHMGDLGCGYAAKLANNMIVGTEVALIAEAFSFAERAGLDPQRLFEAIRGGAAGSAVLEIKGRKMIQREYTASSRLSIHLKDQHNALRLGRDIGAYTPLCALATELMDRMERDGRGGEDVAAIRDLFEQESRRK